jgi:hypothetical protein
MRDSGFVIVVIMIAILGVLSRVGRSSRGASLLEDWARSSGVTLLSGEYRSVFKGPFFWTSKRGQRVY